jgi:hypothetical protein
MNEFVGHIKEIEDDIPAELESKAYILYRFVGTNLFYHSGTVSYLNYVQNLDEIRMIAERHCYG